MTFVEAAIEVLKREGKPLPVKRLAELAVKHGLLSVVGRDPEGTMLLRLADAVEGRASEIVEAKPGVYGLRAYPAAPPPPLAEEPAAAKGEAEAKPDEAKEGGEKRRRRGRRGGRSKAAADEKAEKPEKPAKPEKQEAKAEKPEAKPEAEAKTEEGGKRRRRGGRGRRRGEKPTEAEPVEAAPEAAEPQPVEAAPQPVEAPAEPQPEEGEELLDEDEIDLPGGPLLAPTHGSEDLTRGDEERVLRAEIPGRREERGRHRRDRRDRHQKPPQQHQQQPSQPAPPSGAPPSSPAQPQQPPQPALRRSVLEAALELLRQNDGRPMHVRQLTELAVKKQLVSGNPNELLRQVRAALVREVRERESEGLRARVRGFGAGNYAFVEKKLDQDLAQAERELADKAVRQREATRMALRRRLGRLPPPAFEALARVLLDKLGVTNVELVRRGDGVAYFGGLRQMGAGSLKTLVAVRPGEVELGRRAVGELRAGLQARGYDEGLLLGSGRLGPDGAAELKVGSGVVLHDGLSLAMLLIKHGLGVRRLHLPVDYLDLEFLGELSEG